MTGWNRLRVPIHDQGYQRYAGRRAPHGRAWWIIARTQFLAALKFRPFVILLVFSWVPFVARGVQIYLSSSIQQMSMLAATPQTFRDFLDQQGLFVFLVTIALGGAIADDRRANALQLYLSKPLTRTEYIIGRLVPALGCLLGITFVPAILLLLLQIAFSGSTAFLRQNLFLLPAITLVSLTQALLSSCAILALSSLSKSRRFVSVMYAGIIFFTAAMYQVLRAITGSRAWAAISPGDMMDVVADAVFRIRANPPVPGSRRGSRHRAAHRRLLLGAGAARSRRGDRGVSAIATEHLSKWYGQVSGLNDVTVSVPPGITGLLGPNGAGKSTFMKLVTGQLKPSKGSVRVLGEPIWGNPGAVSAHRLLSGAGCVLRSDDRRRMGVGARRTERPVRRRTPPTPPGGRWASWICWMQPIERSAATARACVSASSLPRRSRTIPICSFSTSR